ncbi:MAG: DMT family transporter [Lentisphaerae bacterium]|nr:DMT family transporter [Lentisphaerota bacterium]
MQLTGIVLGLSAAVFQSVSYVFSRLHVAGARGHIRHILVASHLFMGIGSLLFLPFLWSSRMPAFQDYVLPLLGCCVFYLLGQAALFSALRRLEPSRAAPLLAMKVVILALITSAVLRQHLSAIQWIAIMACVLGSLSLGTFGGNIGMRDTVSVLVACFFYSLSDIHIAMLVRALAPLEPLHAAALGASMCYALCGVVALALLPLAGGRTVFSRMRYSVGFSVSWFLGMVCLYACFGLLGPVFGNILQSTRGILSILLGAYIARIGWVHLEQRVTRRVLVQRLAAAALMLLAIYLFQSHS